MLLFSEFVLNHLHSSHKHRRFNGDSLDMTMVVPQVDVETNSNSIRWEKQSVFSFAEVFYAKVIFARVCVTIALCRKAGSTTNLNGSDGKDRDLKLPPGPSTTQTWPFVEVIPCPLP